MDGVMTRIVRKAEIVWLPWKNGAGEMADIAVSPERTVAGDPEWRVSTARVVRDSPFSVFPDIDRGMMLIEGERLSLHVEKDAPLVVKASGPAIMFAGDRPTRGVPVGGGIVNLNVMSRRSSLRQRMIRWTLQGAAWVPIVQGGKSFIFVQHGDIALSGDANGRCATGDTVIVDAPIEISGAAELIEVSVWPR